MQRAAHCASPAVWSTDGRRLAFYARGAVWVMDENGTHRQRLSPVWYSDSTLAPGPSFSPDGRSPVFSRNPSSRVNASAIYLSRADGTLLRLTRERFAYEPLWSPRGDLIAFRSDRDDDEGDIYVMQPDGTRQRRITRHDEDIESFAWSPDGRLPHCRTESHSHWLNSPPCSS
jgi:Tol biopolymer transport system component